MVRLHRRYDLEGMEINLEKIQPLKLRQLFSYELEFLKTGKKVFPNQLNLKGLNKRRLRIGKYLLADLLNRMGKENDSLAASLLKESLLEALKNNDTLVAIEAINRLNTILFLNGKNLDVFEDYVTMQELISGDSLGIYNSTIQKIQLEFLKKENNPQEIDSVYLESLFKKAENHALFPYHEGLLNGLKSLFYSACFGAEKLSSDLNKEALQIFKSIPFFYSQYLAAGIEFNNAIILYEEGKFQEAIPIFKRVLKTEKELVYRMHGYDWLHKCYDSLGDYGNAYRYFKKVGEVKDSLSLLEHAREIKAIEAQYNFAEKERELEHLANEKNRVQNNFNTLVPFFGIALVLVLIALFLYRKYRRRSELLEEEKTETLKRISQLKKIVIKNHIVLKDKTKVYIADLVYIKAEDHYLKLFLSDNKDHLVRGKIKDIKKQLPPNFIQCHRSYIVNANFIKQANRETLIMIGGSTVPLSRTYKDRF